jgi:uncharacterized membrane protein required for colicin V production
MTPLIFDLCILFVILASMAMAYYRGLIREVLTIVGLGVAVFSAYKLGPFLLPYFNKWLKVPADGGEKAAEAVSKAAAADAGSTAAMKAAAVQGDLIFGYLSPAKAALFSSYGTAFLLAFVFMALLSFFITRTVQEMGLTMVDKLLGAGFGALRGFLMVFLPFAGIYLVMDGTKDFPLWAKNSQSVPVLEDAYKEMSKKLDLDKYLENKNGKLSFKVSKIKEKDFVRELTPEEKELQEAVKKEMDMHLKDDEKE